MSNHITPTIGRIVYYRGGDNEIRPAIVTGVHGPFSVDLFVFPSDRSDIHPFGAHDSVTHADPEQEPGCFPSWHWMPYQKQQAEKHAQVDQLGRHAAMVKESGWKPAAITDAAQSASTSDAAIEQEIQAKGLTAPRLTPADIGAAIVSATFTTLPSGKVMVCELTLRNGFTVRGEAATVSKQNFNVEIGQKISHENARSKVWELEGYLLQERMATAPKAQPAPGAAHAGYSTMQPHQQRVVDERAELDDKLSKLSGFFGSNLFTTLPSAEQRRLRSQAEAMRTYSGILAERIAAFVPA